jgi:hypothetical protein
MATWFEITFTGDPTEDNLAQAAMLVRQGFTAGKLDNPPNYSQLGIIYHCELCGGELEPSVYGGFTHVELEEDHAPVGGE